MPNSLSPVSRIESQTSLFDFMFTKNLRQQAGLNDAEAALIYNMWKTSPSGSKNFIVPQNADVRNVTALKTKGYLAGYGDGIELTEKGKKIIVEFVTHEPNAFEKKASDLLYTKIKSKKAARSSNMTFLKQAEIEAKPEAKEPTVYNLKRVSILKLQGN